MNGDFTRSTFDARKGYSSVRMQQGRVQLDADWNEQLDIQGHFDRTALTDLVGPTGVPKAEAGSFQVTLAGNQATVAGGRMWVGGLLCEADEVPVDPAPAADGTYLLYLDVWQRHVTALEDPALREASLGGADTATRTQTVCRARYAQVPVGSTAADFSSETGWQPTGRTTGKLSARFQPGQASGEDPCELPADAGYRGLENHLYRVEVHRGGEILPNGLPGPGGAPTFKWSRDNGAVVAPWLASSGRDVTIPGLGPDTVRGFHDAPYFVEFLDDELDLEGKAGRLAEVIDHGEGPGGETFLRLAPDEAEAPQPAGDRHPRVRRWDAGAVGITAGQWLALEHGLQVRFAPGVYQSGDYWWIPARTFQGAFAGSIEWPQDSAGQPRAQPPSGVLRRAAPLFVVQKSGSSLSPAGGTEGPEARRIFPSLTRITARDVPYTADPACEYLADTRNVGAALDKLCARGARHFSTYVSFNSNRDDGTIERVDLDFEPKYLWSSGGAVAQLGFGSGTLYGSPTTGSAIFTAGAISQQTVGILFERDTNSPYLHFNPRHTTEAINQGFFLDEVSGLKGEDTRILIDSVVGNSVFFRLRRIPVTGYSPLISFSIYCYVTIFG